MQPSPLVLIVDDAQDNREAYAEYLQYRGFRTAEAENGEGALTEFLSSAPDVVLLDMRLPDFPGAEVSRRMRSTGCGGTIIIALSGCVLPRDVAAAMENGCDAFLAKPCLPDALVSEITRLLAAQGAGRLATRASCS
jgi:CheY-like chemotaxis protein